MRKHLLLLRHAKSDWDDPDLSDIDRPLAPRGERDAPRVGKALREREPQPDVVLCSTAKRARQTAELVLPAAHVYAEPAYVAELYAASPDTLLKIVRGLPENADCALLIGHNPGLEEMLARLTGSSVPMPTAAVACVKLADQHWQHAANGAGEIVWRFTPAEICKGKSDKKK